MTLRVAHVGNFARSEVAGGMEVLTETLAAELAKRGVENRLLSFTRGHAASEERAPGFVQERVPCAFQIYQMPVPSLAGLRAMRRAIRSADVVHVNYPNPLGAFLGAWMAKRAGKKLATSVMSQIGMDESSRGRGRAYRALAWFVNRFLLRYAVSRSDVVFIPSPGYLAVNRHVARHEDRATLLPLGADLARFRPDLPRDHVRTKHGIEGRVVLFLGSLAPTHRGKGLPVLLDAMRILRERGVRDVRLVVAADGSMEAEYMALAERLGVRDLVVHAKGVPREEVPLYFAGADVFTLPSTWLEAFGLVLAEAMACGTPVVGSRIGGIPYVVGDAGLLVEPNDARALADALARVLDDAELARELGKRGRARVESQFTWDRTAARVHEAYIATHGRTSDHDGSDVRYPDQRHA